MHSLCIDGDKDTEKYLINPNFFSTFFCKASESPVDKGIQRFEISTIYLSSKGLGRGQSPL